MSKAELPVVDLRAFVLSAVVVSPFVIWASVVLLWEAIDYGDPIATVVFDLSQFALEWLTWVVGLVVVSVGGALLLYRRSARLRPLLHTLTALVIVGLILLIESTQFLLGVLGAELRSPGATTQVEAINHLLRQTSLLAAVAVASRLYLAWRAASPDPKDTHRFIALGAIALALAVVSIGRWTIGMIEAFYLPPSSVQTIGPSLPFSHFALGLMLTAVSRLVENAGAVFLFGSIAIAVVHWARVESSLRWTTAASAGATLAFAITQGWIGAFLVLWTAPDPNLVLVDWSSTARGFLVAVFGGAFYLFVVDRDALRRAFANWRERIVELRQWPYRPDADK
jgi:hypothetical protein